tara:strand:- start:552 stop:662 length:111 start_codon:yes stop_codon:yes gene_type:complete
MGKKPTTRYLNNSLKTLSGGGVILNSDLEDENYLNG